MNDFVNNFARVTYMIKVLVSNKSLMNQECLHGITGGRVVSLGINNNLDSFVKISKLSVADAVSVTKDGDALGSLLDRSDQIIGSSGDDQVNVVVKLHEIIHLVSAGYQRDGIRTLGY